MNTHKQNQHIIPKPVTEQKTPPKPESQISPIQNRPILNKPQQDKAGHNKPEQDKPEQDKPGQDSHNPKKAHRSSDSKPAINDTAPDYRASAPDMPHKNASSQTGVEGLSASQQQFVLKFCNQLVSVIEACEQSESAEIEVGRRQINSRQIKVKLQAERELTISADSKNKRQH